jgi:SNF2 family DNA or RNA helicase
MRTAMAISLHGQWLSSGYYVIWGHAVDGEWMSSMELKLLLFAANRESFYGTQVSSWQSDTVEGIQLSAVDALEFFTSPVGNPLVEIGWSEQLLKFRKAAPAIKEALKNGTITPSLKGWQDHHYRWRIDTTSSNDSSSTLTDLLDHDEQIGDWVRHLMLESIESRPEQKEALRRLELLQQTFNPSNTMEESLGFSNEQELLRFIGWTSNPSPYLASLRLQEPARDSEQSGWRLTYVLTDQQSREIVLECDDAGNPIGKPPESWLPDMDQAASTLSLWLHIVPDIASTLSPPRLKTVLNDNEAWGFLADHSQRIVQWGGSVMLPAWWSKLRSQRPKLKASMKNPNDTLSLFGVDQMMKFDWKLSIGDIDLTEEEFHSITADQKQLHFIRGEWISLDQTLIEQIRKVVEKSKRRKGIPLKELLQRHLGNANLNARTNTALDEVTPVEWEIEMAGSLLQWMQQLSRTREVPAIPVPDTFHGSLRGYQAQGLSWLIFLRRFGLGGCLADDMGLGKTIQYIAYLLQVKKEAPGHSPSLLICPTSLVGNWEKELRKFAPDLNIYLHYGIDRSKDEEQFTAAVQGYDLVVTTYMTALLDIGCLTSLNWNSLCLDEAQNIKNAYTKQATAIRRIPADHRIAMTGTPVENRLSELWSIFEFMNPGYLGSHGQFQRQFSREVERSTSGDAAEQVRRLIRPFLLRRSKSDPLIVPDLPDKIESKVYVPLTKEQAALYDNVLDELFRGLDRRSGIDRRGAILAALTRLKQICNHPALFTKETGAAAAASPRSHKTIRLLEMVRELRAEGDRCLIFTQYAEMGFLLQRLLEKEMPEKVLYLHGGTTKLQRDRMVETFQSEDDTPDNSIFVLSLKAGGTGLNLTAANHVFHFDRWWNPAVENQATDRAYRIGQNRHVQVHKFISLGTLEERIDDMIEQKQGLTRQITGGSEQWVTEMSTDELQDLFSLRRSWLEG